MRIDRPMPAGHPAGDRGPAAPDLGVCWGMAGDAAARLGATAAAHASARQQAVDFCSLTYVQVLQPPRANVAPALARLMPRGTYGRSVEDGDWDYSAWAYD